MKNRLYLSFFVLLISLHIKGQRQPEHPLCGSAEAMQAFFHQHPQQYDDWNQFNFKSVKSGTDECDEHYVIPVVFHVFHNSGSSFITPKQVQSALDLANNDFNGKNSDFFTIDPAFDDIKGTLNITFVLPTLDPSGNPTTGINYYPTLSGFGNGSGYNNQIATYAWDNFKYLNVYVMNDLYNDGETTNSGVAWYPDLWMSNNSLSRIVYNYWFLGNTGSSIADSEFQSTFTHEIGHWLNLAHTFDQGCNGTGDWVEDTPTTRGEAGCGPNAISCGHITNGENYMDYNSSCYKMFTKGQIERMKNALDNHSARNTIWQRDNLIATGTIQHYQYATPVANFAASQIEINSGQTVFFTDLSCGFPDTWIWTIDGGDPFTSSDQNPSATFNTEGVYDVTLVVSNDFGESEPFTIQIFVDTESSNCKIGNNFETEITNELANGWISQSGDASINWLVAQDVFMNWNEIEMFNTTGYNSFQSLYCPENWGVNDGPTDVMLISPEIDLTNMVEPALSYYDIRGWDYLWPAEKLEHSISILISTDGPSGPWEEIEYDIATNDEFQTWREISNINLNQFVGQKVRVAFQTDSHHYYWRIDDFCVSDLMTTNSHDFQNAYEELNPVVINGRLTVNTTNFALYDMFGRKILTGIKSAVVETLPQGTYIVQAELDGVMQVKKVFIN